MADTRPDKVIDQRSLFGPDGAPTDRTASTTLRDRDALEFITGAPPDQAESGGVGPAPRGSPDLCSAQMASHEMQRRSAEKITRLLEKATYASRPSRVFEDWLRLVEASLDMLPAHLTSAAQHGRLAEDPPEIARLFEELRARYRPQDFERFSEALGILLDDSAAGYMDVIGQVYMDFANPNPGSGQYFTPLEICALMATMSIGQGEEQVKARLMEAVEQAPPLEAALAQAGLLSGLLFDEAEPGALEWFVSHVLLPILPYYRPITVCDPCLGSGRMLLAAAACYPAWAVQLGLVQFFGADIDPVCAQMARINVLLYGLNGTGVT
jgi:type I restriction-modification system DNA methylase subunit